MSANEDTMTFYSSVTHPHDSILSSSAEFQRHNNKIKMEQFNMNDLLDSLSQPHPPPLVPVSKYPGGNSSIKMSTDDSSMHATVREYASVVPLESIKYENSEIKTEPLDINVTIEELMEDIIKPNLPGGVRQYQRVSKNPYALTHAVVAECAVAIGPLRNQIPLSKICMENGRDTQFIPIRPSSIYKDQYKGRAQGSYRSPFFFSAGFRTRKGRPRNNFTSSTPRIRKLLTNVALSDYYKEPEYISEEGQFQFIQGPTKSVQTLKEQNELYKEIFSEVEGIEKNPYVSERFSKIGQLKPGQIPKITRVGHASPLERDFPAFPIISETLSEDMGYYSRYNSDDICEFPADFSPTSSCLHDSGNGSSIIPCDDDDLDVLVITVDENDILPLPPPLLPSPPSSICSTVLVQRGIKE